MPAANVCELANQKAELGDFAGTIELFKLAVQNEPRADQFGSLAQCHLMVDGSAVKCLIL